MTQEAVNSEAPVEPEPKVGPGPALRAARESRHFTQEAVAKQLRIDVSLVRALEEDDYGKFAAPIYVTGHLRAYARLLDLPPESFIAAYQNLGKAAPPSLERVAHLQDQPESVAHAPVPRWVLYGMLTVVVAAVIFISRTEVTKLLTPIMEPQVRPEMSSPVALDSGVTPTQPPAVGEGTQHTLALPPLVENGESSPVPEATPAPADAVPSAPPPDLPKAHLDLKAEKPSWVEVKDGSGKRLFYDLMVPGDAQSLDGVPPFDVLLGYAPGITVEYNGKRVDHSAYARQDMARFRVGDEGTSKN
jgi:cytoskeleton protein RodZ